MIPRIIHYCWFGGRPKPPEVERMIRSWRRYCPDYRIMEWNERNFDVKALPYTREAYEHRKWAFVSDVCRLRALYDHGGIYLDTDVELIAPLDGLLDNSAFAGFEQGSWVATCVIGAEKGCPAIGDFLALYASLRFVRADWTLDMTTNVVRFTEWLAAKGLRRDDTLQCVDGIALYPTDYFTPYDYQSGVLAASPRTVAIHRYNHSWRGRNRLATKLRMVRKQLAAMLSAPFKGVR